MLKSHNDYQESLVHYCRKQRNLENSLVIRLHDVHAFIDTATTTTPITYCPFCGIKVEEDERG
jgi:hypothetical protein